MSLLELKQAFLRTLQSFKRTLPILLGVLMLFALANSLIPKTLYTRLFTGSHVVDSFVGAAIGSLSGGNPLTSYVIAGELRLKGVSMFAITAFLVTWVTVGIIQLPAEALMLGKRFAVVRNGISFLMAVAIAVVTILTLEWL
jgi:uncharacterized membrane protein YraQ (UPF0718 family)